MSMAHDGVQEVSAWQAVHDGKGQVMTSEGQLMTEKDMSWRQRRIGVRPRQFSQHDLTFLGLSYDNSRSNREIARTCPCFT